MSVQNLQIIPIDKIVISKTNPRKIFNKNLIEDLANSISENGLQQAILVRPKADKFELVFGERRLKATKLLKQKNILSRVENLTDKKALEIQIIENKERADVHPLNEAVSIEKLLDFENNTIKEISKILARSESYIIQRIQLTKLSENWKKTYLENNRMTLSIALLVSKLNEADQKQVLLYALNNDEIRPFKDIKNYISNKIIRNLEKSIFDLKDDNVTSNVGNCLSCTTRSGANNLLFADIKTNDVCFNSACYELKYNAQALKNITSSIELEKPLLFIKNSYSDVSKTINEIVKSHNVDVFTQYKEFYNSYDKKGKDRVEAIWVNGNDYGKTTFIELIKKENSIKVKKMVDCTPKEQISKIKIREIRSKELDGEKIHNSIVEDLKNSKELNTIGFLKTNDIDKAMGRLILIDSLIWETKKNVFKTLKIKELTDYEKTSKKDVLKWLLSFSEEQITFIIRQNYFYNNKGCKPSSNYAKLLRLFAEECKSIDIENIEKNQNDIALKRQERQKERIKVLENKN